MTDATDYPMYIDRKDAAVIERLNKGEIYGVSAITHRYKLHTDIRRDKTAKERKNALCESPCMECVSVGRFRFVGTDATTNDNE